MRNIIIIITVLSTLAACFSASVLPNDEKIINVVYNENFPNGTIVSKEELDSRYMIGARVATWNCQAPAISRQSQVVTLQYLGDIRDVIRSIHLTHTGNPLVSYTPFGSPNMYVTITSRSGVAINSEVSIYS